MIRQPVTAEMVRAAFTYDPETGVLERRDRRQKRRAHTGTVNHRKDTSYIVLCLDRRKVYGHRAAWMHIHGDIDDGLVVDHIDGDGLNNRLANLRVVTKSANQRNRRDVRGGHLAGVYYVESKRGFKVDFGGKHAGWNADFFEACCIRKSLEACGGYLIEEVNE